MAITLANLFHSCLDMSFGNRPFTIDHEPAAEEIKNLQEKLALAAPQMSFSFKIEGATVTVERLPDKTAKVPAA